MFDGLVPNLDRELLLPPNFDDHAAEIASKGYFLDASVRVGTKILRVSFYEPIRLAQDIGEELAAGREFFVTRLLVIERVTLENMKNAIRRAPEEVFATD